GESLLQCPGGDPVKRRAVCRRTRAKSERDRPTARSVADDVSDGRWPSGAGDRSESKPDGGRRGSAGARRKRTRAGGAAIGERGSAAAVRPGAGAAVANDVAAAGQSGAHTAAEHAPHHLGRLVDGSVPWRTDGAV